LIDSNEQKNAEGDFDLPPAFFILGLCVIAID